MKRQDQWIAEVAARQRSTLPFDSIRNGALLDTVLIHQSFKLKTWQRAGAIVYGVIGLLLASGGIAVGVVPELRDGDFSALAPLAGFVLIIYIGIRIIVNAVFPSVPRRDEEQ